MNDPADPPRIARGQLGSAIPSALPDELCDVIARGSGARIERIVSRGHVSPPGFWYDQREREYVLLVQGAGRLQFEGGDEMALQAGDWVDIPARVRHRVSWTDPDGDTIWLAVFFAEAAASER